MLSESFYRMMYRTPIDMELTIRENKYVRIIAERAFRIYLKKGLRREEMDIRMDLAACHKNGCPLRLLDLSQADDYNLMHDVSGICVSLDRSTGKLKNEFWPRFAKPTYEDQVKALVKKQRRSKIFCYGLRNAPKSTRRAKVLRVI
jgi:hypothetical protein